jgi:hypothetical protein
MAGNLLERESDLTELWNKVFGISPPQVELKSFVISPRNQEATMFSNRIKGVRSCFIVGAILLIALPVGVFAQSPLTVQPGNSDGVRHLFI